MNRSYLCLLMLAGCHPVESIRFDAGSEPDAGGIVEDPSSCPGLSSIVNGFLPGNCQLSTTADFSRFLEADVVEVGGRLRLGALRVGAIQLPLLERVGSVSVGGNPALAELRLPALLSGDISLGPNPVLRVFEVPVWTQGSLQVAVASMPDGILVPALEAAEILEVAGTDAPALSAPVLREAGELTINENVALTSFSLPGLRSAERIEVIGNPTLPACMAEALESQLDSPAADVEVRGNLDGCSCETLPPTCP